MAKEKLLNGNLINAIMSTLNGAKYYGKEAIIYFTLDIENFSKKTGFDHYLITGIENAIDLPSAVKMHIRRILKTFTKDTGFIFKEVDLQHISDKNSIDFSHQRWLLIGSSLSERKMPKGFFPSNQAKVRAITLPTLLEDTVEGSPACLKSICLFPETVKNFKEAPLFFEYTFIHEIFHVLGLRHVTEYFKDAKQVDYGCLIPLTCYDTIMEFLCPPFISCRKTSQNISFIEACAQRFLKKPLYSQEDLIAARYQMYGVIPKGIKFAECSHLERCINEAENYLEAERCVENFPLTSYIDEGGEEKKFTVSDKIIQKFGLKYKDKKNTESSLLSTLIDPIWKPFISSFVKTFLKEYFIPLLREKTCLGWFNEKWTQQVCFTLLDLYLYSFSLTSLGIAQLPYFIGFALDYAGLKTNETILCGIETLILGYVTEGRSLKNSFFALPTAAVGHFAAIKMIDFLVYFFKNNDKQEQDLDNKFN